MKNLLIFYIALVVFGCERKLSHTPRQGYGLKETKWWEDLSFLDELTL